MSNNFYDDKEDYGIPQTGKYARIEEGENTFRILGSFREKTAIQGLLYWKTVEGKRKPIRVPKGTNIPASELEINKFGEIDQPKFFWAFPVWNYEAKAVQILEITQKTILRPLQRSIENEKWGDPREYDIIITRGKPDEKPLFSFSVNPKEKLDKGILKMYHDMDIYMQALYEGGDPFAGKPINPEDIPL